MVKGNRNRRKTTRQKESPRDDLEIGDVDAYLCGCEVKYKAGDFVWLAEAVFVCWNERRHPPEWIRRAVNKLVLEKVLSTKTKGRTGNTMAAWRQKAIQQLRWSAVVYFKHEGSTWDASYRKAHEALKGTRAQGSPDAMKRSYAAQAKIWTHGDKIQALLISEGKDKYLSDEYLLFCNQAGLMPHEYD